MYKKIKIFVCFLLILILTGCNAQRNDLLEQEITTEDVNTLVETKTSFKYSSEGPVYFPSKNLTLHTNSHV